ncbi:1-acyl-sn-glycerol-3-phosphate acyltransferase [Candidatus Saccharibacteria bacterium]|nr:1-acyl-sn-glycerol-3-phosphate acyltransferase [Candidatus Saccharibacteria bacterium]
MAKAELFQKDIPKSERVFYYESEEDDPIKIDEQEQKVEVGLPEGYEFIPKHWWVRLYSSALFRIFWIFGQWYEKGYWQAKFYGREKLKKARGKGYVMYANHTNPFHDVFGPAMAADRRIFTIISPVNLKIPGIGKFLPMIGGLPLGKTKEEKKAFNEAVDKRLKQKKVLVVYPEAHVWPYYTGVRKFPAGDRSFKYAVRNNLPVFTMTTTYHKRKDKKRGELPRMDIYVDGPFYPDPKLTEEENRAILAQKAYDSMVKYSKKNSYEYFEYKKKSGKKEAK